MNKIMRQDYWREQYLKSKFISFLDGIFGLNLTKWDEAGYWDYENYHPFTYFDKNDNIISHVCLYSHDAVINGRITKIAQFSGVATQEQYRRQGLNRELTEIAIEWAKDNHDFFFLFSDKDAIPFYQKCGFRPVREHKFTTTVSPRAPRHSIQKLNVNDPEILMQIYTLACRRAPISRQWSILTPNLFIFWCLYVLQNSVYYIPELDCLILYEQKENKIIVYDIVAEDMPEFDSIYPYIANKSATSIEFLFMIDKLNLTDYDMAPADENNNTHLMGECPVENKPFIIPITAQA